MSLQACHDDLYGTAMWLQQGWHDAAELALKGQLAEPCSWHKGLLCTCEATGLLTCRPWLMGVRLPKLQGLRGEGVVICCIQDMLRHSSFDGHTCRKADSMIGLRACLTVCSVLGKGGLTKAAEHGGKRSVDHPCRYTACQLAAVSISVAINW